MNAMIAAVQRVERAKFLVRAADKLRGLDNSPEAFALRLQLGRNLVQQQATRAAVRRELIGR